MVFRNRHVDPVCNPTHEHKHNLGVKETLEECLEAVKASKVGNVGLWHRGSDKSCHICDLHARGLATSLSYIESDHVDALVKFSGHTEMYSNDGTEFMRTTGQWLVACHNLPTNLKYITTQYGTKTDFFKPLVTTGGDWCGMLQA